MSADVRSVVSRAQGDREAFYPFTPDDRADLGGIPVVSSRFVPEGKWLLADGRVFVGEHASEAVECITAELVACTLGARHRPELVQSRRDYWRSVAMRSSTD